MVRGDDHNQVQAVEVNVEFRGRGRIGSTFFRRRATTIDNVDRMNFCDDEVYSIHVAYLPKQHCYAPSLEIPLDPTISGTALLPNGSPSILKSHRELSDRLCRLDFSAFPKL